MLRKAALALATTIVSSPGLASAASLTFQPVVTISDVPTPMNVQAPIGDTKRLYILDRSQGVIKVQDRATGTLSTFMTLPSDFEATPPDYPASNAYSFAFDPANNGKVYVSYVDTNHDLRVIQASYSSPNQVDQASIKNVLSVQYEAPFVEAFGVHDAHYGGELTFGGDGKLYVTTGDDWWTGPGTVQTQNPDSLQGKVLRIDPNGDSFPGDPLNNFAIPDGNPFVAPGGGAPKLSDSVYATGFRNPYRATYDPATGAFFIGDVGQDLFEEINLLQKGGNYGWPIKEGTVNLEPGAGPFVDPIQGYDHTGLPVNSYAVIMGPGYRGPLAQLNGKFFYGDFSNAKIWSFMFDPATKAISEVLAWDVIVNNPENAIYGIISFGTDGEGNLYVVSSGNGIFKLVGTSVDDVPLPAGALLLATGLAGLGWSSRKKTSKERVRAEIAL